MPTTSHPLVGGLLVAALMLAGGCSGGAHSAPGPDDAEARTLRIAVLGTPRDSLDPSTDTASLGPYLGVFNVFDSLVLLQGEEVRPGLATRFSFSDDARALTLEMDPEATFSDGSKVTAGDALASLKKLSDSSMMGPFYSDVDFAKSAAATKAESSTVSLVFSRPRADFVGNSLAMMSTVAKGGNFAGLIGSGPFKVQEEKKGSGYVLERNPHRRAKGNLAKVEVQYVSDPQTRAEMVHNGQADLAVDVPMLEAGTTDKKVTVESMGSGAMLAYGVYLNTRVEPFSDPALRSAAKKVIDRRQLVNVVFQGQGSVGNDLVGAGLPGYDESLPVTSPDLEAARKVFAAKGVTSIDVLSSDVALGINDSMELIRQQFESIGVKLTITTVDPAAYFGDMKALMGAPMSTAHYVNRPVGIAIGFSQGKGAPFNISGFTTPKLEKNLASIASTTDDDERQALETANQRIVHDEGGEIIWGFRHMLASRRSDLPPMPSTQNVVLLGDVTLP